MRPPQASRRRDCNRTDPAADAASDWGREAINAIR